MVSPGPGLPVPVKYDSSPATIRSQIPVPVDFNTFTTALATVKAAVPRGVRVQAIDRGFLPNFLGLVVQLVVLNHAINLVSAFAVKSTMGTTRA